MALTKIDEITTTADTIKLLKTAPNWYTDENINPWFRLLQSLPIKNICVEEKVEEKIRGKGRGEVVNDEESDFQSEEQLQEINWPSPIADHELMLFPTHSDGH
uniref:Uncharacterized protein n=1 Tax=Tetranychus urticae TaxID=32264 RepID=T1KI26_TETUR